MTRADTERQLIKLFTDLQTLHGYMRLHEGPFEPTLPQIAWHVIWTTPAARVFDVMDTWSIVQRCLRSKDGFYDTLTAEALMGHGHALTGAAIKRERPPNDILMSVQVLREIRRLAEADNAWLTFVLPDGSWFYKPARVFPGVLMPTLGELQGVPLDEYGKRLAGLVTVENDDHHEDLAVDLPALNYRTSGSEVEIVPDENMLRMCRQCGAETTEHKDVTPGAKSRECKACKAIYTVMPNVWSLDDEARERFEARRATYESLADRIADEFGGGERHV